VFTVADNVGHLVMPICRQIASEGGQISVRTGLDKAQKERQSRFSPSTSMVLDVTSNADAISPQNAARARSVRSHRNRKLVCC